MAIRATTDYAVLGMLTFKPMSGYEIRATIGESIAYFWAESYGQIYPALKRLTREKLVTRTTGRAGRRLRHQYAITAAGREALAEWLRNPPAPAVPRNGLLFKLFFARYFSPDVAVQHVQRFRAEQEVEHLRCESLEEQLYEQHGKNPDLVYWLITLRFGQLEAEAHLRWAEEALQILAELQAPAAQAN